MKKRITFFLLQVISLLLFYATSLFAQDADSLKTKDVNTVSTHSISLQIIGMDYGYEQRLGGDFSMVFRAGIMPNSLLIYQYNADMNYQFTMVLGVNIEPRYYINFNRRTRLGKSTFKNSGDFVAMRMQVGFGDGSYIIPDGDDYRFGSKVKYSITPMYGIRRVWGKHWFGEFTVGVNLAYKDSFFWSPHLQYRFGFVF